MKIIRIIITFNLVTFAWIFFRANSLADGWYIVSHLSSDWPNPYIDLGSMAYGIISISCLFIIEILQFNNKLSMDSFLKLPILLRWGILYIVIFTIILAGVEGDGAFIYNQF